LTGGRIAAVERLHTPRIRGHSLFVSGRGDEAAESLRFARLLGAELRPSAASCRPCTTPNRSPAKAAS
jgi:hypothetical protein